MAELAERLEEMDRAEGVFGEARLESVPDRDLEQAAAGAGELDLGFDSGFFLNPNTVCLANQKGILTFKKVSTSNLYPIIPTTPSTHTAEIEEASHS